MDEFMKDQLMIKIFESREEMGGNAAEEVVSRINELLSNKKTINMVFAAAPSQNDFLKELIADNSIDWSRIVAFHLDEYVGLENDAKQKFGTFLDEHIFNKVDFKEVYYIDQKGLSKEEIIDRYNELLKENPIDIACIGIGENGHIAFNDPHVADFADTSSFKLVDLDEECRTQQVNDGCFSALDKVPTHALTMTVPAILSADFIYCIVPSSSKSRAVKDTVNGPIETACPASILRSHPRSVLYIDKDAAELLQD